MYLKSMGYFYVACRESIKILDTFSRFFSRTSKLQSDKFYIERRSHFLDFCSEHVVDIYEQMKKGGELSGFISHLKYMDSGANNPFLTNKWKNFESSPAQEIGISFETIKGKGFERVKISHIPMDRQYRKTFLFAEDAYKNRYFIHKSTMKNATQEQFYNLQEKDELAVILKNVAGKEYKESEQSYVLKN